MTCRCHTPVLYSDPRHEAWCACGHHPREDLGEDRPADERLRYRVLLDRLRRSASTPGAIVDEATAAADKKFAHRKADAERLARKREAEAVRALKIKEARAKAKAQAKAKAKTKPKTETPHCHQCGDPMPGAHHKRLYCSQTCKFDSTLHPCARCGEPVGPTATHCYHCMRRTPELIERHEIVAELYREGVKLEEIAKRAGIVTSNPTGTVNSIIRRMRERGENVPRRNQRRMAA